MASSLKWSEKVAQDWDLYDPERPDHPVAQHTCVKMVAQIKDLTTGEVRDYQTWTIYDEEDGASPSDYMWSEGNYSCDCNRHLFFNRAAGVEPDDDAPCGDTRYVLNAINPKTGKCFYREFE